MQHVYYVWRPARRVLTNKNEHTDSETSGKVRKNQPWIAIKYLCLQFSLVIVECWLSLG